VSPATPPSAPRLPDRTGPNRALDPFELTAWDDAMPVPAEYRLSCEGCGQDLTGMELRLCPRCGRRFNLPIPQELDLHCLECGYALAGLTSRICPECGTGFDVRGLRQLKRFQRPCRLRDRVPWYDLAEWFVGIMAGLFGVVLIFVKGGVLSFSMVVISALVAARSYSHGTDASRIALVIGLFWGAFGLLLCAML